MEARRQWNDIFKVFKEKTYHSRILYPEILSFKNEGEIKKFIDKQKLKKLISRRFALHEMLKGVLQAEIKSTRGCNSKP